MNQLSTCFFMDSRFRGNDSYRNIDDNTLRNTNIYNKFTYGIDYNLPDLWKIDT
jgi:hypothetical protein